MRKAHFNGSIEYRSPGDSPAVGAMMYPDCGRWNWRPAPEFEPTMHYCYTARFVLEDFYARLAQFVRGG